MVGWVALVLAAAVVSLLVAVPGATLLAGAGTQRPLAIAAGPAVTVAIVGVATVVMSRLGITWDARTAVALLAAICGAGALAAALRRRRGTTEAGQLEAEAFTGQAGRSRALAASVVGAVTAGGAQVALFARAVGRPDALLQNTDAMVQLNLIAEIERSGDASMLTAAIPVTGGNYPTAWHAFSVFLAPFASTPFVFNAMAVALFAVLFPTGMGMLTATASRGTIARIAAPWLALAAPWFPGLMLTFSAQASGAFAIALVPSALAAVVLLWRRRLDWRALLLVAVMVLGIGLASPGAGQWAVEVGCLLGFMRLAPRARSISRGPLRLAAVFVLALVACLPLILMTRIPTLQAMGSFDRGQIPLWSRFLAPVLLNDVVAKVSPVPLAPAAYLPLAVMGFIGLILFRRRVGQVPTAALAAAVLCVWITGLPEGPWWALVGGWWRDYPRFLALEVIPLAFFGALGLEAVVLWLHGLLRRPQRSALARRIAGPVAGAVALALLLGVCAPNTGVFRQLTTRGYIYLIHPPWVTDAEALRMEAVGAQLPDDAVVYGFPQSGAGLIPVLTPATSVHRSWSPAGTPDEKFIAKHFDEIDTNPRVCEIVRRIGGTPYYYEDSDISDLERWMRFPGYDEVDLTSGFELVAVLDTAHLYRLTACD
ncbi:DUF6541 family protein [Actinomyces sp. 565]|uniref:DUF6541 family protein n=1 Tax=Actinomyces sp. 565 TaxID=2057794 RepID=UPI0013A688AE|nr:DUF6541 family protein [Actinomyces sp. 565]NDR52607.1 hypothetical protein [Actinomyces sp. 565]